MSDSKYFSTTKKGELYELKAELCSDKKEKKKEAVKKIIANMTVGKDVSALFTDVVNCMQTDNLELKKLVYLYLINYAKSQPDLAILAVNTFVKDCEDPNPLIRALAVRTMGCIRVEKITEYLCDPLRRCLKDEDPYVRKTAAVCVAKLHDINSQLVEDQGFLDQLRDLISDSNPMVVANAVAALSEIASSSSNSRLFEINPIIANKLLTALNECTEWGQIFILDAIATYVPKDEREAQSVCERITSRLAHANAAVVLSAVKVLMKFIDYLSNTNDFVMNIHKKLAPPLVTLLSAEAEIQYVALRNINLILQKKPDILRNELRVFFVKYNDPIYVKLEKLDIMIRLTNAANINQVLSELKEYATEVDVDFVRKSVRAIGRCAIKVESAAEKCVNTLLDLVQTKVNYVVQEAVVVIKDIFRKYPNKYESIISALCENLDSLDEPEARASMIWIIGEYAERIENAAELLDSFLDGFVDESNQQVQLQLLTAVVKLFLKKPTETQALVTRLLQLTAQDCDNPDLRDRGYIYWRLLSTDPQAARDIVLAEKPLIGEETDLLEPSLLDELISYIGTLASVYHKPPSSILDTTKVPVQNAVVISDLSEQIEAGDNVHAFTENVLKMTTTSKPDVKNQNTLVDILDLGTEISNPSNPSTLQQPQSNLLDIELENILGGNNSSSPAPFEQQQQQQPKSSSTAESALDDLFDLLSVKEMSSSSKSQYVFYVPPKQLWLAAFHAKGLEINGTFSRRNGNVFMEMQFSNNAMAPLTDFAMQLNKNSFCLTLAHPIPISQIAPGQSVNISLQLTRNGVFAASNPLTNLQVAVKNNMGVFYFAVNIPIHVLFDKDGLMENNKFITTWKSIETEKEFKYEITNISLSSSEIINKLQANNIFTLSSQLIEGIEMLYQSMKFGTDYIVLAELKIVPGQSSLTLSLRSSSVEAIQPTKLAYEMILRN